MSPTLKDALLRTFHTFWQAFLGALAISWSGVHFDAANLTDLSADKKLLVSVLVAVVAAVLAAAKSTAALVYQTVTSAVSKGDWTPAKIEQALADAQATPVPTLTPADPAQPAAGVPPQATSTLIPADGEK